MLAWLGVIRRAGDGANRESSACFALLESSDRWWGQEEGLVGHGRRAAAPRKNGTGNWGPVLSCITSWRQVSPWLMLSTESTVDNAHKRPAALCCRCVAMVWMKSRSCFPFGNGAVQTAFHKSQGPAGSIQPQPQNSKVRPYSISNTAVVESRSVTAKIFTS